MYGMKKTKNPLRKRLFRELKADFGKYIALFLFMVATIGFVSGFLVAAGSMQKTFDESFDKYNIEDGHFVLKEEASDSLIEEIEKKQIEIYSDYYVEEDVDTNGDSTRDGTLRIFGEREEINKVCVLSGELPKTGDEIALDRVYMSNNKLKVGDTVSVAGKKLEICGIVALSDYSALFQDNSAMMFDANLFGVGVVINDTFEAFGEIHKSYSYGWKYDTEPKTEKEEKKKSDKIGEKLVLTAMQEGNEIEEFLPNYANRAIHFAGEDLGSDKPMMTVLLYVLIAIIGFVFAVTVNNTVEKEATVIGTLRASGYTKGEIFRHYITIPLVITFTAAIIGNILGYTVFEDVAKIMYQGSFSFTTYVTNWNEEAFVLTTVVPMIIVFIVIAFALGRKMSLSPLRFIRKDLDKKKKVKVIKLGKLPFLTRFRIRIILQNFTGYITLFIGILFAALLLMFGMIMPSLMESYGEDALKYKPCNYQYILYGPYEIENEQAEPYCVTNLKMQDDFYDEEEISIYGLQEDSKYYKEQLPENGVMVTSDMAEKYQLEEGDIINLQEEYEGKLYAFRVEKIFDYPTNLGIYMSMEAFAETFEFEDGYFNGYFSNEELTDSVLPEEQIVTHITDEELTRVSRQMDDSMGEMFGMVQVFAIVLFILLIYLLTKQILEKNAQSISMVKVLGYGNGEIAGLYIVASIWGVIISAILSLVFNTIFFQFLLRIFMNGYGGWFRLVISMEMYLQMFFLMLGTYLLVAFMQFLKIKKIPMSQALKNVE